MIYLLQNLLMKLKKPERVLASIIPYTPEMPTELVSELKIKLKEFETLLSNTEELSEEQSEEWTQRLVELWLKYCSLCKDYPKGPVKQELKQLITETPVKPQSLQVSEMELAQPDDTILKAIIPSSFPIYKYKPRNQTVYHAEENFPKYNDGKILSKTALRVKMQNAFFDLVVYDENDLEGLAALLRMLSLASKLGEPFARDIGLRYDFFEYAKSKMPVELSNRVRSLKAVNNGRSVSRLFYELKDYIIEEASNRRAAMDAELCLKCFKIGHSKTSCQNEPLPVAKIG